MKRVIFIICSLLTLSFLPNKTEAAGITLTQFPQGLVSLVQTVVVKWQEPISATMKYGTTHGSYPFSIGHSGTKELSFIPREEGISPGVYYCVIVSGSFSSQEFPLMVESPQAPVVVSPANQSVITTSTPTFTWDEVAGVPFYHVIVSDMPVEIFEDENGELQLHGGDLIWQAITPNANIVHGSKDPSGFFTDFNISSPPIMENLSYTWIVLNNYSGNPAHSSLVQGGVNSFTADLDVGLQPPNLISPSNNTNITSQTITFEWSSVAGVNHYQLFLSEKRDEQGSDTKYIIWSPITTNTIIELPARDLLKGTEYTWKIAAINAAGNGILSSNFKFTYDVPLGILRITTRDQNQRILPRTNIDVIPQDGSTETTTLLTTDSGLLENPVQPGTYEIRAYKNGYADTSVTTAVGPNETVPVNLTLRLLKQIIRGRVLDTQSSPVDGANILAEDASGMSVFTALSDLDGYFNLEVPEGDWLVHAHKPGYLASDTLSVKVNLGQTLTLSANLILLENGCVLNGKTVTSSGVPLVGVTLRADNGERCLTCSSNSNGLFSFLLTADTWTITAQKIGYISPIPRRITLQAGTTTQLQPNIVMSSGAAIVSGFAKDDDKVINGVKVTAIPDIGYAITTFSDTKGSYAHSLAPGNYQISADKAGYVSTSTYQIQVTGEQTVSGVDFLLTPGEAFIEGRVTDGSSPMSGVVVRSETATDTTHADGRFRLAVLHGTHRINAFKREYASNGARDVSVDVGEVKGNVNFTMSSNAGTVDGTVRSGGQPVPGAKVEAKSGNQTFRTTTGFDGTYWFSLPAGIWDFTAGKIGFNNSAFNGLALNAGQYIAGVDISLSQNNASLQGRVQDNRGRDVKNATIEVLNSPLTAVTDLFGAYALSISPGSYDMQAFKPGYKSQTKQVTINQGSTTNLNFQLQQLGTIWGTITTQQGNPLPDIPVLAVSQDTLKSETDHAGQFFLHVDTGSYQLIADDLGYAQHRSTVSISLGESLQRNITLTADPSEIATVRGRIQDSEGQPLVGIGLQITGNTNALIHTDISGEFDTGILAAGELYTITPFGNDRFFVPQSRTFNPLRVNQTSQNFLAGLYGDVSANEQTNSFDGSLVLRVRAEQDVSPYYANMPRDSIAADVSGGSGVSSFDASLIFRYAVGLITSFPVESGKLLKYTVDSTDIRHLRLELAEHVGGSLFMDIVIDRSDGIFSTEHEVQFDPDRLQFVAIEKSEMTENLNLAYSCRNGRIRVAMAGTEPLSGLGILLTIRFRSLQIETTALPAKHTAGKIDVKKYVGLTKVQLNEAAILAKITGDQFALGKGIPDRFQLYQCYPNPFNMRTTISYDLPESNQGTAHNVSLRIVNTLGQTMRILYEGKQSAGRHKIEWDGRDDFGREVASGVYFYEIRAGVQRELRKLLLVK